MATKRKKGATKAPKVVRKAYERPLTISKEFRKAICTAVGASFGALMGAAIGEDPSGFMRSVEQLMPKLKEALAQSGVEWPPGWSGAAVAAQPTKEWWAAGVPGGWRFEPQDGQKQVWYTSKARSRSSASSAPPKQRRSGTRRDATSA